MDNGENRSVEDISVFKINNLSKFKSRERIHEFRKSYSKHFYKIFQKTTTIKKNTPKFSYDESLFYRSVRFYCAEKANGCKFQVSLNLAKNGQYLELN